jgi:hypothetical protein
MPAGEQEEMPGVVEQPFLVDVAVVLSIEALFNGLGEAADDLLKTVERNIGIGLDNGAVMGIDDDGSRGDASGSR